MFTKITQNDLEGKGVVGQPTVPGLSVLEMQQSVEQIVREVAIPAVNRLIEELAKASAAQSIGAQMPGEQAGGDNTLQTVLEKLAETVSGHTRNTENPHAVTAGQVGAFSKEETEERINAKIVEIGEGDMTKAVYDSDGDGVVAMADEAKKLAQARYIGQALFDGTHDIPWSEIGPGKLLWQGSFSSGSITVPGLQKYQVLLVVLEGGISCVGTRHYGIGGIVEIGNYEITTYGYRTNGEGEELYIDEICKGGSNGKENVAIVAIYGLI